MNKVNQIILQGEGIDNLFAQLQQFATMFQAAFSGQMQAGKYSDVQATNASYTIDKTIEKLGCSRPTYYTYRKNLNITPIKDGESLVHTEEDIQKLMHALYPHLQVA